MMWSTSNTGYCDAADALETIACAAYESTLTPGAFAWLNGDIEAVRHALWVLVLPMPTAHTGSTEEVSADAHVFLSRTSVQRHPRMWMEHIPFSATLSKILGGWRSSMGQW